MCVCHHLTTSETCCEHLATRSHVASAVSNSLLQISASPASEVEGTLAPFTVMPWNLVWLQIFGKYLMFVKIQLIVKYKTWYSNNAIPNVMKHWSLAHRGLCGDMHFVFSTPAICRLKESLWFSQEGCIIQHFLWNQYSHDINETRRQNTEMWDLRFPWQRWWWII